MHNVNRRAVLKITASTILLIISKILSLFGSSSVFAMGKAEIPQGMQKIEGEVTINKIPAKTGDIVNPEDIIETGNNSSAVFVVGDSAYMMKENSRLIVKNSDKNGGQNKIINALKIIDGKLLSVFGSGEKNIETPTAYIGIRGTAMYIEVDHEKTYLCACYGRIELSHISNIPKKEIITTKHHETARYIYSKGDIKSAPMLNHTDTELIMLESLAGRVPPFKKSKNAGVKGEGGY